jgi:Transcriptional repressor TCF25
MGLLLVLDFYALATNEVKNDDCLIEMAESDCLRLKNGPHHGSLLEMPNWMYSYALALFRRYQDTASDETKEKADLALQKAICSSPQVVSLLVSSNDVDTTGQSCRHDWSKIVDFVNDLSYRIRNKYLENETATELMDEVDKACGVIIRIFVQLNSRLWSSDAALDWLYRNVDDLRQKNYDLPVLPCLALARYRSFDRADYEPKFSMLPNENLVDAGLIAHAMVVDTRRPRLIRPGDRDLGNGLRAGDDGQFGLFGQQRVFAGPPTNMIDPDLPLVEVFWRSFLPWNHVDGVAPPRR